MSQEPEVRWTIPERWVWTTISQLGHVVGGGTPSTKEPSYWADEINWISPADLTSYSCKTIGKGAKSISKAGLANSSAKLMPAGSVHFSSRAPVGYVVISSEDLATNQGFKSLIPMHGIYNRYVYYYLMASQGYARKRASGTTFLELSGKEFGRLPVPLAPQATQHRIVAKIEELFSELDKGVESLKTARTQLNLYRQSVLKQAFEGKLTADWRNRNKDKLERPEQLLARLKQDREARYERQLKEWSVADQTWDEDGRLGKKPPRPSKPSKLVMLSLKILPRLPDGWIWVKFGALCSLVRNGISVKPEGSSGRMILRISAVRPMALDLEDVRYIADESGEFDNYHLQRGDLIFTRYNGSRAYVGVCAEYRGNGNHLYPDKLIRTKLGTPLVSSKYLEKALNCGASRSYIEGNMRTTAGQSGVSGADIREIPVPICSLAEQLEIHDRTEEKLSRTSSLLADIEQTLEMVKTLRSELLARAFSGQLVPQDTGDESASILLDRIRAERERAAMKRPQRRTE